MANYPRFPLKYEIRWKYFHAIMVRYGKFSIYQPCFNAFEKLFDIDHRLLM